MHCWSQELHSDSCSDDEEEVPMFYPYCSLQGDDIISGYDKSCSETEFEVSTAPTTECSTNLTPTECSLKEEKKLKYLKGRDYYILFDSFGNPFLTGKQFLLATMYSCILMMQASLALLPIVLSPPH